MGTDANRSEWLTAKEAADYLRTSRRCIYKAAKSGDLQVSVINGRGDIRTCAEWLDAFVRSRAAILPVSHGAQS